jgi:T4 RnlA family RNA ligase
MVKPTLLTYEQAKSMVDVNGDLIFYESTFEIEGFKVSIFNYRLAQFSHFMEPLPGSDINGLEMRGLTFVFNKDGSLYKRYLMLPKFFNLNQVPDSMYDVVKNYKVDTVMNKEDGSLIGFVRLPNGKAMARTKMSFESEQALAADEIYNNNAHVKELIDWSLDNDVSLFFEFVSFTNRIVLDYKVTELILLRARDNKTGKFIDVRTIDNRGVTVCNFEDHDNLDEMIELANTVKEKEGWVIQFDNDYMIKIKTQWYCDIHHLNFGVASRENDIIRLTLDEEIDDVIAQLSETDTEKREFINEIIDIVNRRLQYVSDQIDERMKHFDGDVKKFSLYLKGDKEYHHYCLRVARGYDKYALIKERFKKETTHLKQAQKWVEKYR